MNYSFTRLPVRHRLGWVSIMFPADRLPTPTIVEVDRWFPIREGRVQRSFPTMYEARRYFVQMDKQGRNPKVIGAIAMCPEVTQEVASEEKSVAVKAVKEKTPRKSNGQIKSTKIEAAPNADPKGKKETKKSSKTEKKGPKAGAEYGMERDHDVAWCEKKVAIFKALKTLRATSATTAVPTPKLAEKAGVSNRDARHYCYHAMAAGLTKVAEMEDVRGYCFYLTAAGQKIDPVVELKKQSTK